MIGNEVPLFTSNVLIQLDINDEIIAATPSTYGRLH
jgi:hypothetical protein